MGGDISAFERSARPHWRIPCIWASSEFSVLSGGGGAFPDILVGTRGQVAAGLSESATGRICTSPSSPAVDVGGHYGCCLELGGGGQLRGILIGTGGLVAMGLVRNAPQAAIAIVSSECATGRRGGSPAVDSLTSQSLTCKATRGRWKHPPPSHTQTVEAPTRTASAQLSSSEVF